MWNILSEHEGPLSSGISGGKVLNKEKGESSRHNIYSCVDNYYEKHGFRLEWLRVLEIWRREGEENKNGGGGRNKIYLKPKERAQMDSNPPHT